MTLKIIRDIFPNFLRLAFEIKIILAWKIRALKYYAASSFSLNKHKSDVKQCVLNTIQDTHENRAFYDMS